MDSQSSPFLNQLLTDSNCWAFPNIVSIWLEGKTKNSYSLIAESTIKLLVDNLGYPMLGPFIELDDGSPIVGDRLKPKVLCYIDKIENIFFEATTAKARPWLQKTWVNSMIRTNRLPYFMHLGASLLTQGGDGVNRGHPLGQESISS